VVLQPGEAKDLTVTFRPTAAQQYRETILLQVNGLYTVNVIITGWWSGGCFVSPTGFE